MYAMLEANVGKERASKLSQGGAENQEETLQDMLVALFLRDSN